MRAALLFAASLVFATPATAEPVLLISIDGLRPGDVLEAEQRGLKIPNLRKFVAEGAFATGVKGVLPTVTYPSHTTLITGMRMFGKMSVGVRMIESTPKIRMSNASTMNVYGRRRAIFTIPSMQARESSSGPLWVRSQPATVP